MLQRGLIGFLIAISMHAKNGWWLDGGDRVREMLIVLAIAALIVGFWWTPMPVYRRSVQLWAGFMVGTTVTLFVIGPGNIFPIVLGFAALLSAVAVLVGSIAGMVREAMTAKHGRRSKEKAHLHKRASRLLVLAAAGHEHLRCRKKPSLPSEGGFRLRILLD